MAARTRSPPLYAVFLEQVIQIEAVQRERAAVTDEHTADFFELGRIPGDIGTFLWSLDAAEPFPQGIVLVSKPYRMSPAMQRAWDAALVAWRVFINKLVNDELIAGGEHAVTGIRSAIDPAEWTRAGLVLEVRDGDLYEVRHGRRTLRWSRITLRAAKQPQQRKARGHGYDWEGAWAYGLTLRVEDQWDWTKVRRDKKQLLPAVRKYVEDKIKDWFAAKGSVPDISDIRRNIIIPLYAGRRTRGKRKR